MTTISEALRELRELNEDLPEDNSPENIEKVKQELADLEKQKAAFNDEYKEIAAGLRDSSRSPEEHAELRKRQEEFFKRAHPIEQRINELKDYLYSLKTNIIADDEDWNRFFMSNIPTSELEYHDLDLPVKGEFGGNPIPDNLPLDAPISYEDEYTLDGTIYNYTYSLDSRKDWDDLNVWKKVMSEYLGKPVEEITKEELFNIDERDLEDWLLDYFEDDAAEQAREDWEAGLIDYDSVSWHDYD